ncbi:MAG: ABC transporter permease [Candidatus Nanoarchaeia archaeon]
MHGVGQEDKMLEGISTLWIRSLIRFTRSKSRLIGSFGPPLLILLIAFGLNSVVNIGGTGYVGFLIPGIVVMSVLFASVTSGIQIIWDKQFGFLKETLVAPVSRLQIMLGQTFGGATTACIQGMLIMAIGLIVESRITTLTLTLTGFLIAFCFMILVGIAFTALGVAIASRMEDFSGFGLIMNFVVMPVFALSGALFPLTTLPSWMKVITYIDPLTYGVQGVRYGLSGTFNINPLLSFVILAGFAIVMILIGAYSFKKIKFN